jgi:hypothetical protein
MVFKGIAEGQKLSVLFTALQGHCSEFHIRRNSSAYRKAGMLTLELYREGATAPEALVDALRRARLAETSTLKLGQRVTRKDTTEGGTVVEADSRRIKVKWDGGATSYYRRGRDGNVVAAK